MTPEFAREHLALVLSFFLRVESQISVLLGVEVAMVGYLMSRLPAASSWRDVTMAAITALAFAAAGFVSSFISLYLASFPKLKGGENSMIYFRAIAARPERGFSEAYGRLGSDALVPELSEQIWRNSEILTMKYDRLKYAFLCFAAAGVSWVGALILLPA
jgi:hypothetical protein